MQIRDWELEIDLGSRSVAVAAQWLDRHHDDAIAFFKEAENNPEYFAHFETPDEGEPDVSHHFTLEYKGEHKCYLRKREGY
jgi:hypothetical protein